MSNKNEIAENENLLHENELQLVQNEESFLERENLLLREKKRMLLQKLQASNIEIAEDSDDENVDSSWIPDDEDTDRLSISDEEDADRSSSPDVEQFVISFGLEKVKIRKEKNGKNYICPEVGCGYTQPTSANVRRHYQKHTRERPFQCKLCNKKFGTKRT